MPWLSPVKGKSAKISQPGAPGNPSSRYVTLRFADSFLPCYFVGTVPTFRRFIAFLAIGGQMAGLDRMSICRASRLISVSATIASAAATATLASAKE